MTESNLERKWFISTHTSSSQSIVDGSQGQELKQEPEAENMIVCCLLAHSLAYAHTPQALCLGMSPLIIGIHYQSRQSLTAKATGQSDQGNQLRFSLPT